MRPERRGTNSRTGGAECATSQRFLGSIREPPVAGGIRVIRGKNFRDSLERLLSRFFACFAGNHWL